ncbi:DUF6415 family natural product biosynthesis protein [Streptomyces olindensis]|uniref:DUF6415 family natural product biosynthesis protein n=1 Tax=Streptomyces olindensis TaxID=358823 RepID=UPI003653E1BC
MNRSTTESVPLDLETMRACAARVLATDTEAPHSEELETVTLQLRGHIMLTVPEVETAALALPMDAVPRACALLCVGEARLRLSSEPGRHLSNRIAHAQRLARSVRVLCDHYEDGFHQCPSAPERAAYLRMLEHYPACSACRTVDDNGEVTGVCPAGDLLYEQYRQARRGPAAH